jgi:[CysO sulfur-carrier protein]-S-L-cysteine hydrolase
MVEKLILGIDLWRGMRKHVRQNAPLEACGLLAGKNGRVEMRLGIPNAERSPVRYRMEPMAQLRAFLRYEKAGLELLAIYHSHPNGPDHPSPSDTAEALYPVVQIIWFKLDGRWMAGGYRIEGGKVKEISLELSKTE